MDTSNASRRGYGRANVLLCDPQHNIRVQTRAALKDIGFVSVVDVSDLQSAAREIATGRFSLLILALNELDDGTVNLIHQIRGNRHGPDPFVPIIVSLWRSEPNLLGAAINAGVDDLIKKPFSTSMLTQRVRMLVDARKPFVATGDYLGPDRRRRAHATAEVRTVRVPNSLRAQVCGTSEDAPNHGAIAETLANLERLKVRNIAQRIHMLADSLADGQDTDNGIDPEKWSETLRLICEAGATCRKALRPEPASDLGALCDAITNTAASLQTQPASPRRAALMAESALALKVASEHELDGSSSSDEIAAALNRIAAQR